MTREKSLEDYTVLLFEDDTLRSWSNHPITFVCQAEDTDHAEEQAENAYPNGVIVWAVRTNEPKVALADYYGG